MNTVLQVQVPVQLIINGYYNKLINYKLIIELVYYGEIWKITKYICRFMCSKLRPRRSLPAIWSVGWLLSQHRRHVA